MQFLSELQITYKRCLLGLASYQELIAWGINRLQADEEGDDLDVVLLASTNEEKEAIFLVEKIIRRHAEYEIDLAFVIGKELIDIRNGLRERKLTISTIESVVDKFYRELAQPSWLTMLSRNCEYATDIDNFVKPFNDELDYICSLWERCSSFEEFDKIYDRAISNSHDLK